MPVVLTDVQVAFTVGALFADAGAPVIEAARRRSEASLSKVYNCYMLRSLAYASFILGPVATVFYAAYPAWETQYMSAVFDDTAGKPANGVYYGLFLSLLFAGAWFGNWLGFKLIFKGARLKLRILYLSIITVTFAVFFLRWPAPARVGSYRDFQRDPYALPSITEDRTFFIWFLILSAICALPIIISFLRIRRAVSQVRAGSVEPLEATPFSAAPDARSHVPDKE